MEQYSTQLGLLEEVLIHFVHIGEGATGFVYKSRKNVFHIFLSDSLSDEAMLRVLTHEYCHIKNHMPANAYFIGLDIQDSSIELEAKEFEKISCVLNEWGLLREKCRNIHSC